MPGTYAFQMAAHFGKCREESGEMEPVVESNKSQ